MRGLRFLPVLATVACADLSGLTDLVVDGGAPSDASTNPDGNTNDTGLPDSGGVADAAAPFCASLAISAYTLCADFDEGDVTKAYEKGVPASWSNVSSSAPTLTTASPVSMPAAAAFVGSSHQALAYTTSSSLSGGTLSAQVRVDTSSSDRTSPVVLLQLASDYTIALTFVRSTTNAKNFGAEVDELHFAPDGGMLPSTPHVFNDPNTPYAIGAWHTFAMSMNAGTLSATFDTDQVSFLVAPTSTGELTISIGYSATGWAGSFDDVYFYLK